MGKTWFWQPASIPKAYDWKHADYDGLKVSMAVLAMKKYVFPKRKYMGAQGYLALCHSAGACPYQINQPAIQHIAGMSETLDLDICPMRYTN